jgi:2'-5' RNA ligase
LAVREFAVLVGSQEFAVRVFVGVEVGDEVKRQAGQVVSELRQRVGSQLEARWVPLDNLHLTVRFIGHVADDRAPALLAALGRPLSVAPFEIESNGCGRFPPRGGPRVLWIGLSRGLASLTELHVEFNRRVAPFGYAAEDRPFAAHLTLARIRDAGTAQGRLVDDALSRIPMRAVTQRVEYVTVFESRLSSKGSQYAALQRIAFET